MGVGTTIQGLREEIRKKIDQNLRKHYFQVNKRWQLRRLRLNALGNRRGSKANDFL